LGAFIANVQVWKGKPDRASKEAVVEAFARAATGSGEYERAAEGEEGDRSILVAESDSWIGIYDETLDTQDVGALDRTAAAISRDLQTWALGILVHDSDVLMFRLHENGELIDTYNSNPEYFGRAKAAERRAAAGRAQKWKKLLSPGRKVTQLREAFKGENVIVDEKLLVVAALVGIDPDLAVMSHRYLVEDGQPDLLARCSRLSLRRLPLAPEVAAQIHLKPVDSSFERIHPFDGERWIGESVYLQPSFGCAVPLSRSIGVQLSGNALDSRVLTVHEQVHCWIHDYGAETWSMGKKLALLPPPKTHEHVLNGLIPQSAFPPSTPVKKKVPQRLTIQVNLNAQMENQGEGELRLRLTPQDNPDGGGERIFRYRVVPQPPINFPAGARPQDAPALRKLYNERVLFGMAVIDGDANRIKHIVPRLESWARRIQPLPTARWIAFSRGELESWEAQGPGVDRSENWRSAIAEFPKSPWVVVAAEPPANGPPVEAFSHPAAPRRDGFSVTQLAPDILQVGMWARRIRLTPDREQELALELRQTFDTMAVDGGLLQACIGRQDWGPTGGSLRDAATPYEEVLNHFPPHRLASTLPNRLRNFASELWLGPAMQTALRREEVESVAMLEAIGDAWHLTIRPGRTLAELESVLEAIRPRRPTTEEVLAMERTQTRTGDG